MSRADRTPPEIDYLAKDYESFRRLMLDRLSQLVPDWREQSPADLGHALVEVLAYAADYLSYYQDAVATEAYLGTARLRRSVRRHARLLDYHLHEGCNARAWVQVQVSGKVPLRRGTQFLTRLTGCERSVIRSDEAAYHQALQDGVTVFETMHDAYLLPHHNEICFYCSEDNAEYLPRGSTSASLSKCVDDDGQEGMPGALRVGDVLVLEELRDPRTGLTAGANPAHRHAVRLTEVTRVAGERSQEPHVKIKWAAADALPFALCIAPYFDGPKEVAISVARGNIVLADHGRTIRDEKLPFVQPHERYRPRLQLPGLTHAVPFFYHLAGARPASEAVQYDPQEAVGWVRLRQHAPRIPVGGNAQDRGEEGTGMPWALERDLLNCGPFDRGYVVEKEENGVAYLRFGSGGMGKVPLPGDGFVATYRVGNGTRGNIGADTIAHVVAYVHRDDASSSPDDAHDDCEMHITSVRNPLPARGGRNPEDIESARLNAPHAFRTQLTCVTQADYAALASRHPAVAQAVAQMRWIGSGHTVLVYAQRADGQPEDDDFRRELRAFMEPCRLMGHDIEVEAPRYVPVRVRLRVYLEPRALRLATRQALSRAFSEEMWPDGEVGFFHPDRFRFGQSVHQSQVIAWAMRVAGVQRVEVERLRRSDSNLDITEIRIGPAEIARLDRIDFGFEGGL